MYWLSTLFLGLSRQVSGIVPLQPVTSLDTFATDTHWACIYILADVEDANESICKPYGNFPDFSDLSNVRSTNVRYCSHQERRAGICHAKYRCEVLKDVHDCSREQLSQAMASEFTFRCINEWNSSPARVWIYLGRAVAQCVYEQDWQRITGTRWMESDERQYELQRVTIAALNVVAGHVGPDVMHCIDHFYWHGS